MYHFTAQNGLMVAFSNHFRRHQGISIYHNCLLRYRRKANRATILKSSLSLLSLLFKMGYSIAAA